MTGRNDKCGLPGAGEGIKDTWIFRPDYSGPKLIFLMPAVFAAFLAIESRTVVQAEILTVAHVEYTSNWNPVSSASRTAQIASDLTHERLFSERCIGSQSSSQQGSFTNWCLQPAARISRQGTVRLLMSSETCHELGRSLTSDDIKFTTDLINSSRNNRFWVNKLRVDGKSRLKIGFPSPIGEWSAKSILTFPIVRKSDDDTAEADAVESYLGRRISAGDEDLMNQRAGGTFKYEQLRERSTILTVRRETGETKTRKIDLKYFPLRTDLYDVLAVKERPDVALGLPTNRPVSQDFYNTIHSPDLNSFTYVGLNFGTKDFRVKNLFRDVRFRALLTKSLWGVKPIRNGVDVEQRQMNPKGIFIGQSFDAGDPRVSDSPNIDELKPTISNYLLFAPIKKSVRLTMLLAPDIENYFDRTDRRNIESQLNDLWSGNERVQIKFKLIDPSGGEASYRAEKLRNRHHMTFETFNYGRSKARYMMFVEPSNALNSHKIDLFSETEIGEFMASNDSGRRSFLNKVSELYPVAVIGHFPRRDLHSTEILKPDLHCPSGAFASPYAEVQQWQRK
jgi:hypothetical protein